MMRRLRPSLFVFALLLGAACLRREVQARSGSDAPVGTPGARADAGAAPSVLFELHARAALKMADGGQHAQAAQEWDDAASADPDNPRAPEALSQSAFSFERAQLWTEARLQHERLWRTFPAWEHLGVHLFRAAVLAEDEGDLKTAQVAYEWMLSGWPDGGQTVDALHNLARVYEQRGGYERAYEACLRWAAYRPRDPEVQREVLRAAMLLSRHGDVAAEVAALGQFLRSYPAGTVDPGLRQVAMDRVVFLLDGAGAADGGRAR